MPILAGIDPRSDTPTTMPETVLRTKKPPQHKRHQIAHQLRALSATMVAGERLPSVAQLEAHFGVATATVESAIAILRREGLVESRPGSGTYIAARPDETVAVERETAPATGAIAVFAVNDSPFYKRCVEHIVSLAAEQNRVVDCRFANSHPSVDDVARFEALGASGFLFVGTESRHIAQTAWERGHVAAVIGEPPAGDVPQVPTVYADAEHGGYVAARHLLDLGHRRIGYVHRMPPDNLFGRLRWRGHERALREAGVTPERAVINGAQLEAWRQDPAMARAFFARPDAPTAVAAWSDPAAVMLLGVLRRAGIHVPNDVSVIGYDNLPIGEDAWPPLDTVDQHLDVLVRHALFLLTLPSPQATVSTALVTPTLVRRESCAAPPLPPQQ